MEDAFNIDSKESDLSLPTTSKIRVVSDALASSQPTWSNRYKCFQAYICLVMSYLSSLRFCQRVGNYKVTIFIPYFLCNIFIGVPAVLVEVMLGRFVMGNVSNAWNMCVPARGVFWCLAMVTSHAIILNYIYNIYLVKYFFASFHGYWGKCSESWNEINCYKIGKKSQAFMKCRRNHSEDFCHQLKWETSALQFWKYHIQDKSNELEIFFSFLCLALAVIIISVMIYKGILSLEKMLGLLVYPSVVLWAILVVACFSTSNALSGFKKLFHFSWHEFTKPQMWVEGFEDMFYLLGVGKLSLSFISSHGNFTDNILIDVIIVTFGSITFSLLITTPILSIIASVRLLQEGTNDGPFFDDVTDVFVAMSEALLYYPNPSFLWSALYYLDCFVISLSSQAVLVLALCKALEGIINKKKSYFYIIIVVSLVSFFAAGFLQFIECIRDIDHSTVVVTTVMLCTITWQLFYGIGRFNYDYFFMMGYPLPRFLRFTWITLLILPFVELVLKMYYKIPRRPMENIVYIFFGITLFVYFLLIIIHIVKYRILKENISKVFMANPNWGPENTLLKKSRLVFETSTVTREFMYRQELYKKPFIKPPDFSDQNIVRLI